MESLGDGRPVGSFRAGRVNTSTSSKPAASRKRESADLSAPGGERNGIRATPGQSLGHQVSPRSKGECREPVRLWRRRSPFAGVQGLPAVGGGVPLIFCDFPRAGGSESLPAAGGKDAHVAARTPTPPIAPNAQYYILRVETLSFGRQAPLAGEAAGFIPQNCPLTTPMSRRQPRRRPSRTPPPQES